MSIRKFWTTVDARLLVAGSVKLDVVEHAHEIDPVCKICRRGILLRKRGRWFVTPWTTDDALVQSQMKQQFTSTEQSTSLEATSATFIRC